MKKFVCFILCAAMALSFAACGSKQNQEPATGMPNPMHESSQEEIRKEENVEMKLPEGAENAVWMRIVGDTVIDEVTFDYKGASFCYRVEKTDALEDISGIYTQWGEPEGGEVSGARCLVNEGREGVIMWYADGHSYNVSMTEGADGDMLTEVYQLVK